MKDEVSIIQTLEEHIASDETLLPVFDGVSQRIVSMLQDREYAVDEIEELVHRDPALATAVLRHANSSFFGGMEKVTTVRDAMVRLGSRQVCELVLLASQRANFHSRSKGLVHLMGRLWTHAVACALGADWIARRCELGDRAHEAFLGGLLHDAGKLLVLRVIDDLAHRSRRFRPSGDLVLSLMDQMHCEQGERLLRHWNLPEVYCTIVRDHHAPEFDGGQLGLVAVRLADTACAKLGLGLQNDPSIVLASTAEAHCLAVTEVMLAELEIFLEDAREQVAAPA